MVLYDNPWKIIKIFFTKTTVSVKPPTKVV